MSFAYFKEVFLIETIIVIKGLINAPSSPHLYSQSEREEFETDYKQKYERERVLMMDENKKLSSELDNVSILLVSVCPIVTVLLAVS